MHVRTCLQTICNIAYKIYKSLPILHWCEGGIRWCCLWQGKFPSPSGSFVGNYLRHKEYDLNHKHFTSWVLNHCAVGVCTYYIWSCDGRLATAAFKIETCSAPHTWMLCIRYRFRLIKPHHAILVLMCKDCKCMSLHLEGAAYTYVYVVLFTSFQMCVLEYLMSLWLLWRVQYMTLLIYYIFRYMPTLYYLQ